MALFKLFRNSTSYDRYEESLRHNYEALTNIKIARQESRLLLLSRHFPMVSYMYAGMRKSGFDSPPLVIHNLVAQTKDIKTLRYFNVSKNAKTTISKNKYIVEDADTLDTVIKVCKNTLQRYIDACISKRGSITSDYFDQSLLDLKSAYSTKGYLPIMVTIVDHFILDHIYNRILNIPIPVVLTYDTVDEYLNIRRSNKIGKIATKPNNSFEDYILYLFGNKKSMLKRKKLGISINQHSDALIENTDYIVEMNREV